jgi:hypothetical protein
LNIPSLMEWSVTSAVMGFAILGIPARHGLPARLPGALYGGKEMKTKSINNNFHGATFSNSLA